MANYQVDLRDIEFNLLDVLDVARHEQFGFANEDVKDILSQYNKFVENEIFPTRTVSDEEGVKLEGGQVYVAPSLHKMHKAYYENGWYALGLPEEIGGVPVSEALKNSCASLSIGANTAWMMYPVLTKGAMNVIHAVGDDYLKSTYIEKIMAGTWGGTMCLTEAGAGSDVGNLKSTATPIEGKKYKIKGTKIFISSGDNDLYENMVHLVLARTPGAPAGSKGITLFVVPKLKINDDGSSGESNDVVCTNVEHKMGIHASATCVLNFGDEGNCEGYMIGEENDGMATMFLMMNEARIGVGVQGEAQGNLAYLMAEQYARERVQFQTEIIEMPDVKRSLLRMRSQARGMRALCLYTSDLFDQVHENPEMEGMIGLLTPICKGYCSDVGFLVASEAVQVHGGYGFCTEYGMEQFIRDTKIAQIYEGTNGIQAMDFVMRKVLKDGGKSLQLLTKDIMTSIDGMSDQFAKEKGLFSKVLGEAQNIMGKLGGLAKDKQMNQVLQHCTDFLLFASQLVVAWRLYECARVAETKLTESNGEDEKAFLESKIIDFKTYCSNFLVHNIAISKTITDLADDITTIRI